MSTSTPRNTTSNGNMTGNLSLFQPVAAYLYFDEPESLKLLRLFLVSLLAILGFFGNLWVSIQVFNRGNVRSPVCYYIRNLAIADMGVLSFNFPIAIIREQMPLRWPLGPVFCHYFYPLTEVFHGASIWSIAAIAAERYRGMQIRSLNKTNSHGKKTYVKYILLAIWFASFSFTSLPLFFLMKYDENAYGKFCNIHWPNWTQFMYVCTLAVLWYLLPLAVVIFTYIYIAGLLRRSTTFHRRSQQNFERSSSNKNSTGTRRLKENRRARKILTPLILVFAITMLPLNALRIIASIWPAITQWKYFLVIYNLSVIAIVINSASDPLIYSIVTKDFCRFSCHWFKWLDWFRSEHNSDSKLLKRNKKFIPNLKLQERQNGPAGC